MTFQAANPTMETHPSTTAGRSVSELLEDSGNRRPIIDQELSLHLLSDSLFSEQQKLRHVLDGAHTFLSSRSEVHSEFCRADSVMLADEEQKYQHPVCCDAGGNEVFGGIGGGGCMKKALELESNAHFCSYKPPFSDHPHIPYPFNLGKDEVTWPECRDASKTMALWDATNKQNLSQENTITSLASNGATCMIKESTSCWNSTCHKMLKLSNQTATDREISGQQVELNKVKFKGKERTQEQVEKTSSFGQLKIPSTLTVYEQYQLCVDQLHHLRVKQKERVEPGCFIDSPARDRETSEHSSMEPEIQKHLNKVESQRVTAAEKPSTDKSSDVTNESKYMRTRETLTEYRRTKHCDNLRNRVKSINTHVQLDGNKSGELIKGAAGDKTSTDELIKTSVQQGTDDDEAVPAGESAAVTTNSGLFPKRTGRNSGVKRHQSGVKGQKEKAGGRGISLRLCEKSSASLSASTKNEMSQRPQSSQVKRCFSHIETHTPLYEDPELTYPALDERRCVQTDCKPMPAGVAVSERWLCLPDEVWLSILSLLPLRDLCRVMQVCSRLHTLASDHTLWRSLRVENSTLTEQWFLCVGRRRPRSLSLYSCSGPSLSSCGLETFFSLCGKFLEELQVTSCTGPCLHGDQMLPLIGQWCDHVTGVDVSWSGATDRGVNALSDCCPGLRLKSVVLNGCQVTDDPLMKLVMRHKKSLCRLEVFGCQFLSPSCLQRIFEMCPGLQHLNIGQVPKVNADSLTMMTSQLKGLISLNLTGLQAVNDATVGTLLQGCVKLQSLTLSSCPGVTDLTLHSISKYTPYIRSLDVSSCKAVTDAGVQSLALGCKRLQQLDLSSTSTGNRGVMLLANYCSGHLHTVKLSFCHITSEIILKLCRRCKRLKVLHLYGCARLPPTGDIRRVNSNVKVYPPP